MLQIQINSLIKVSWRNIYIHTVHVFSVWFHTSDKRKTRRRNKKNETFYGRDESFLFFFLQCVKSHTRTYACTKIQSNILKCIALTNNGIKNFVKNNANMHAFTFNTYTHCAQYGNCLKWSRNVSLVEWPISAPKYGFSNPFYWHETKRNEQKKRRKEKQHWRERKNRRLKTINCTIGVVEFWLTNYI